MERRKTRSSRKDRAIQALVLGKSLVEGHELKARRASEGSQVRVVPDLRRENPALSVVPPGRLDVRGFVGERNARVAPLDVVFLPGFAQRQGAHAEHVSVGCQPQETLLRHSAKKTHLIRQGIEPGLRGGLMDVRVERQSEPDINVGEKHLPRPESPRCVRRLDSRCRADRFERGAPESAFWERSALFRWRRIGHGHGRSLRQRELALQNHDAVVDATTDFHTCILSHSGT
jgi:hypothetical protein